MSLSSQILLKVNYVDMNTDNITRLLEAGKKMHKEFIIMSGTHTGFDLCAWIYFKVLVAIISLLNHNW